MRGNGQASMQPSRNGMNWSMCLFLVWKCIDCSVRCQMSLFLVAEGGTLPWHSNQRTILGTGLFFHPLHNRTGCNEAVLLMLAIESDHSHGRKERLPRHGNTLAVGK